MFDFTKKKTFSFTHQLDNMDCGPACLKMIAEHYGRVYPIQLLRDYCNITKVGASFLGISDAAEKIGLRSTATMPTFSYFAKEIKLPCIVHWNQQHFVIVYKIGRNRHNGAYEFHIADPAYGFIKYKEEDFKKCWCSSMLGDEERGVAMVFTPMPAFYENTVNQVKLEVRTFVHSLCISSPTGNFSSIYL